MRKATQNWLGWADRSYEQIKKSVLARITVSNPELTDHSESNPLIILISIFAAIAEMLHVYIDQMGRESFLGTAQKFSSILKIVRLLDYRVKTCIPAYADLTMTLVDATTKLPKPYLFGQVVIPKGATILSEPKGIPFIAQEAGIIYPNYTKASFEVRQYTQVQNINLGLTNGLALFAVALPDDYVHNSLGIVINSLAYIEYETFGYMGINTRGFIVDVDENGKAWAIFGDGVNGVIPPAGYQVVANYKTCLGPEGNLPANTITNLQTNVALPPGYELQVTNSLQSNSGSSFETLEEIRDLAPRHMSTLRRAVTYRDYIDIALMAPGVGQAEVTYCCPDDIKLYITPKTRGVASKGLLSDVKLFFEPKRIMGRCIEVLPAGIVRVWFKFKIQGRPGYTDTQIRIACILALNDSFGFNMLPINGDIAMSDVIAVLEALDEVDSVIIETVFVEPYARPVSLNTTPLGITWGAIKTTTVIDYRIIFKAGTTPSFDIYKNNLYYATVLSGQAWSDGNFITFTLHNTGLMVNGDEWTFRVYPTYPEVFPLYSIDISDFTIPIIDVDLNNVDVNGVPAIFSQLDITLGIGTDNLCKPNC